MGKTAFVFPGQGAQITGMGKDFYEKMKCSREVFERASDAVSLDLKKIIFEENENLNLTEYTQIALLTVSVAIEKAMEERGLKPDVCAGLSLGEYSALTVCKRLNFEDACRVVRKRGIYMQEAVPSGKGIMAAVLGAEISLVEEICKTVGGIVEIANYNCPGQVVISGEREAVEKACETLKEKGIKKTVLLKVSGPFHSSMLKTAGEKLEEVLKPIDVHDSKIPYLSNVTGDYVTKTKEVKSLLKEQVWKPVKWQQSVEKMIETGTDTFIEIGPGKTLTGFIRKIDRNVQTYHIGTVEELEKAVKEKIG